MSELLQFVDEDVATIVAELVAAYEAESGKPLFPGQVEQLFINLLAYRESLARAAINDAARQNLLAFARAPMLDYLGELVGVSRLPAEYARSVVRLTFAAPLIAGVVLPADTLFDSAGGIQFVSETDLAILPGAVEADVPVIATQAGTAANGLPVGRINSLVDSVALDVVSVANLDVSGGGADDENDEQLRERIRLAPEAFSVAGSRQAYQFHARGAHPSIVAVGVLSPAACVVSLYPLTKTGLPGQPVIDAVLAACSGDKVRPLTDQVQVLPPLEFPFEIRADVTLYQSTGADAVMAQARLAGEAYIAAAQARLGHDIEPSQIIAALQVTGVKRVALIAPAAIAVPENGWPHCTGLILTLAGVAND